MSLYIFWVITGITLIIVEMMTGTFYLLVIGIAAFGAALAAWFGLPFSVQAGIAALLAVAGVLLMKQRRKGAMQTANAALDIGQKVTLESWFNEAAGLARVQYRGAQWDAQLVGERGADKLYFIQGIEGGVLRIGKDKPAPDASS